MKFPQFCGHTKKLYINDQNNGGVSWKQKKVLYTRRSLEKCVPVRSTGTSKKVEFYSNLQGVKALSMLGALISPFSMNPHTFIPALDKAALEAWFCIEQRAAGMRPVR